MKDEGRMIYVASNYSDPDPVVMQARYLAVNRFTALGMKAGFILFSPIAHCHPMAVLYGMPTDSVFWRNYCLSMLDRAKQLVALCLPGFRDSAGLIEEVSYCSLIGIPVTSWEPPSTGSDYEDHCIRFWQRFNDIGKAQPDALDR